MTSRQDLWFRRRKGSAACWYTNVLRSKSGSRSQACLRCSRLQIIKKDMQHSPWQEAITS